MPLDQDGKRRRYFSERTKVDATQGSPLRTSLSPSARHRLLKEIEALTERVTIKGQIYDYCTPISRELAKVFAGSYPERNLTSVMIASEDHGEILTALEVAADTLWRVYGTYNPIARLQSILADDLSVWRYRNVGTEDAPEFQMQRIDPPHLHREIVDRAFEVTQHPAYASAQRDYADAWRHHARGDFDDAVTNAGKAVESACKVVIAQLAPARSPDQLQLGPLVDLLGQLGVLPTRMQTVYASLSAIFKNSGSLRNAAGVAHGSVALSTPEESVTLLALRLSGSLITFLAERHEQMNAGTPMPAAPAAPVVSSGDSPST